MVPIAKTKHPPFFHQVTNGYKSNDLSPMDVVHQHAPSNTYQHVTPQIDTSPTTCYERMLCTNMHHPTRANTQCHQLDGPRNTGTNPKNYGNQSYTNPNSRCAFGTRVRTKPHYPPGYESLTTVSCPNKKGEALQNSPG